MGPEQISQEEVQVAEKIDKQEELNQVGYRFGSEYFQEIVDDGQTPSSYLWNGRRILRSTLQCMASKLVESNHASTVYDRENTKDVKLSHNAPGLYELQTNDPNYQDFVESLNEIMKQYDNLFTGSEKIREAANEETA
ncbi:MAG: hypothetical protein M1429_00640 [Patescibacteria group bacterium]|nr:hypothetical protein [Patescibacteria group bacterium]